MKLNLQSRRKSIVVGLLGAVALNVAILAMAATPQASRTATKASVQKQLNDFDAKLAEARAHNAALQAKVTQMEQHSATQQKMLQQRDAEIAALQRKLTAAGAPASATSVGQ